MKEALAIFRLAAEEAPKDAAIRARIGVTHAATGDRESAITAYRQALQPAPGDPEATEMLSRLEK